MEKEKNSPDETEPARSNQDSKGTNTHLEKAPKEAQENTRPAAFSAETTVLISLRNLTDKVDCDKS